MHLNSTRPHRVHTETYVEQPRQYIRTTETCSGHALGATENYNIRRMTSLPTQNPGNCENCFVRYSFQYSVVYPDHRRLNLVVSDAEPKPTH
jgi:hypothetical protein